MGRLEVDLTPQHVQEKQFHDAFRGYNHEEVDRFLDQVAEAFAAAYKEREECRFRIRELEGQLEQARSTEEILKRTLLHANKAADEAIRQARATSQKIVAESERKAEELVTDAKRRTHGIVERAQAEVRELEQRADGLRRFEHDYRAQLRAFIDSQLRALSGGAIHSQQRLGAAGAHPRPEEEPPSAPHELPGFRSEEALATETEHLPPDIPETVEPVEWESPARSGGVRGVASLSHGTESHSPEGANPRSQGAMTEAEDETTAGSEEIEAGLGGALSSEEEGVVAPQRES